MRVSTVLLFRTSSLLLPDSCVNTAWHTEQGHILRDVVSCEVSGWQAKCFLRLPSFT